MGHFWVALSPGESVLHNKEAYEQHNELQDDFLLSFSLHTLLVRISTLHSASIGVDRLSIHSFHPFYLYMSSNTTPPPGPETPPKTPQVRIAPSHSDTPRTRPKGSNVDKGLSTAREEVYAEVDPPREVPIEFFFEHLLPETLPLAESKKIVTKMKKKSRRTPTNSPLATQEGRLSAFLKDPGDMGLCENDAYSSIPDILHGIFELVKEAHEDFSPKTHFKFTPNQPIPSDLGYTGKPDGAMFLNSEFCFTPDFQWLNVVGVGQWKLQSKDSAEV